MKVRSHIKRAIDLGMVALLPLLMAYNLIGDAAHEWIGASMFVLMITHNILNLSWYRNLGKGKCSAFRVFQLLIDWSVFLCMIGLMVSGIMLSRHVFRFLPIRGGISFARTLHMLAAYWGFILMSLHVGLHASMMMATIRKAARAHEPSIGRTAMLRAGAILLCAYGAYAFGQRQIGSYMLMLSQFVFFDFREPLVFFFADYLAVMGMLIIAGHYLSGVLRRGLRTCARQ